VAVRTLRLGPLQDGNFAAMYEVDQTAASRADGWTVAKTAATNQSDFDAATKQLATTFAISAKPASFLTGTTANAIKVCAPFSGVFANTAWTFTFAVRATVASSQAGRIRLRVYKSANADGTSATELTAATQVGTTSSALSTSADVTSVVTWSPGATITLTNEYLFFAIAWEITTASGSTTGDVVLRTGQSAAGSRLVTPDFTATAKPKMETLTDSFDTTIDKVTKWSATNANVVWDSGSGGRAKIPCTTSYYELATNNLVPGYDLTGSYIFVQPTIPPVGSGGREVYLELAVDATRKEQLLFIYSGGNLLARRMVLGANAGTTTLAYSATNHAWWRIRESGGTIFWDTSSDGTNWTNFTSIANPFPVTNLYVVLYSGYFGTETAADTFFDNVNVAPLSTKPIVAAGITNTQSASGAVRKLAAIKPIGGGGGVADATVIQSHAVSGKSGTALDTIWDNNCTIGSTLFGIVFWNDITATCSIADPNNGTWTPIGSPKAGAGSIAGYMVQMFVKFSNVTAGKPLTIATISKSVTDGGVCIIELAAGRTIIENSVYATSAAANPSQVLTPAVAGDAMVAFEFCESSPGSSAGAGWTIIQSATWASNPVAVDLTMTPGTPNTVSWTSAAQQTILGLAIVGNPVSAPISFTNNVSGGITKTGAGALKPVTPAGITNTNAVGGSIGVARKIVPAGITNNQAVSGSLRALRRITPTGITNTQTVSGALRALRAIRPTTVATNNNVVSGALRALRAILPAGITNTQSVTGNVSKPSTPRPIVPASVTNTQSVSGAVAKIAAAKFITPTTAITNTQNVSGSLVTLRRITPTSITNTQQVAGVLRALRAVKPTGIANTQTVAGAIRSLRAVKASGVTNTQSVAGAVTRPAVNRPIGGTATNTQSVSGSITTQPVKVILPAGTTNTQQVSGAIRALRVIKPSTGITNTNAVSGVLRALRVVRPTTVVTNTQQASGSLRAGRGILPTTTIANSQVVTGSVRKLVITPSGLTNTNTVSGGIRRRVSVKPTTTVTFTTTVAGVIVRRILVRPASTISSTNTVSGFLLVRRGVLPGLITNTNAVSGSFTSAKVLTSVAKLHPGTIVHSHKGRTSLIGNSERIQLAPANAEIALGDRGVLQQGE
jgi:hypothetical protein